MTESAGSVRDDFPERANDRASVPVTEIDEISIVQGVEKITDALSDEHETMVSFRNRLAGRNENGALSAKGFIGISHVLPSLETIWIIADKFPGCWGMQMTLRTESCGYEPVFFPLSVNEEESTPMIEREEKSR